MVDANQISSHLNVRGLIHQLKGRKLTESLKFKTQLGFLQEVHFKYKATDTLEMGKMLALLKFQVTILILDKANFRSGKIIKDEEVHYRMIKKVILQVLP